ncbi:non-hydrolyzing UDP-N-acetylglucosamine 2-epimerase [Streptomyces noursei]
MLELAPSSTPTGGVAVILGTRPEIIKLSQIIFQLGEDAWVVNSGQHYDTTLSEAIFRGFGLPAPQYVLEGVGGLTRSEQFGRMFLQLDAIMRERRPDVVIVQGDTNTVSAGAQVANQHGIPVIHVEAGLRSFDRTMPEEINRMVVGAIADVHCAPTYVNVENLLAAGLDESVIHLTGNTVVEATLASLPDPARRMELLRQWGMRDRNYILATVHRPANVDDPARLSAILSSLASTELPVLMPLHPRTRARIAEFGLGDLLLPITVTPPVDHGDFLGLALHSRLLVSDSGGIQEECTVIKKPLLVLRDNTERQEAVEAGFARLAVPGPGLRGAVGDLAIDRILHKQLESRPSPYGDGRASTRIVDIARSYLPQGSRRDRL